MKAKMAGGTLGLAWWVTSWCLALSCLDWFVDYSCIVEPWNDASFVCTGECPARIAVVKTWCKTKTLGTGYSSHMLAGFGEHYGSGSVSIVFSIGGIMSGIVVSAVFVWFERWLAARDAAAVEVAVQAHMAQVAAVVSDDADVVADDADVLADLAMAAMAA
jgi:hypothetical protein